LGAAVTKTSTNDASDVVCASSMYVFFSSCFFDMLTNDLILAQGKLMTTVGEGQCRKQAQMTYLAGVAGVQT
jgi:hypothetical protein